LTTCQYLVELLLHHYKKQPPSLGVVHTLNPEVSLFQRDKYFSDASPVKPQRLMKELSECFPPNTRFLADTGNSMVWAPHYLNLNNRRAHYSFPLLNEPDKRSSSSWLRLTLDFAPMGWAIGAAIGVARANPACPTVCLTGDGAYLMSGQEITVAAKERLTVIYVILNDSAYGMVMHGQRLSSAEPIGYELPKVDFCRLVQALNINAYVVKSPADFSQLDIEAIINHRGPTLIDVHIDPQECPPMEMRLKDAGSLPKDKS